MVRKLENEPWLDPFHSRTVTLLPPHMIHFYCIQETCIEHFCDSMYGILSLVIKNIYINTNDLEKEL